MDRLDTSEVRARDEQKDEQKAAVASDQHNRWQT
jgi:hypothetical protein